ncbi:MAG: cytochrome P450 [Nostoc sp. ChiQUE01a]|nr:cytochrome P450 [Nostoc sp. ChiQUE01a]
MCLDKKQSVLEEADNLEKKITAMKTGFELILPGAIKDKKDYVTFYLNLSRTNEEIVPYLVDGRTAFLINRPEHAEYVLVKNQNNYTNPYHQYAELAGQYTPTGAFLLNLDRTSGNQAEIFEGIVSELAKAGTVTILQWQECSKLAPVQIDIETKKMMFAVYVKILFNIDAEDWSEAFVSATNFIEEYCANQSYLAQNLSVTELVPLKQSYQEAIEVQNAIAARIGRCAGLVAPDSEVSKQLKTTIVRTLLNSYNGMATALCWIIYQLVQCQEVLEQVYSEVDRVIGDRQPTVKDISKLSYMRLVVMEVLRLYPPAWMLGRQAINSDRIGETLIPPGAIISLSPYTMHRKAQLWERPKEFIPERFASENSQARPTFAYFPFGGGIRKCPAGQLVFSQLQIILAAMLRLCSFESASNEILKPRGLVSLRPHPGVSMRITIRK